MESNPDYFKGEPKIARFVAKPFADQNIMNQALMYGNIDMSVLVNPRNVPEIQGDKRLRLQSYSALSYQFFGYNVRNPLLTDKRVRKAFTLAINRDEMLKSFFNGQGSVISGPFAPGSLVCTAATFVFMGKIHSWLILPAIFIAPIILFGSAFVQLFVLFHWFEGRALVQTINRRAKPATRVRMPSSQRKPGLQMGPVPPVPWILATIVLVGPLAMLAHFAWHVALAVLLLIILIPVLYAYIDR